MARSMRARIGANVSSLASWMRQHAPEDTAVQIFDDVALVQSDLVSPGFSVLVKHTLGLPGSWGNY